MYNHLGNEISYSKLKLLDQSVVEYYNRYILKLPEPTKTSYRFGNAFDAYITEPVAFKNNWIIKDTATTTLDMHITQAEHNAIIKMAESLHGFNNWNNQCIFYQMLCYLIPLEYSSSIKVLMAYVFKFIVNSIFNLTTINITFIKNYARPIVANCNLNSLTNIATFCFVFFKLC